MSSLSDANDGPTLTIRIEEQIETNGWSGLGEGSKLVPPSQILWSPDFRMRPFVNISKQSSVRLIFPARSDNIIPSQHIPIIRA
jgi:hypothetical protein